MEGGYVITAPPASQETPSRQSISSFIKPGNAIKCATKGNMTQVKNWVYGICFLAKRTTVQLLLELSGKYILLPSLELLLLLKTCSGHKIKLKHNSMNSSYWKLREPLGILPFIPSFTHALCLTLDVTAQSLCLKERLLLVNTQHWANNKCSLRHRFD